MLSRRFHILILCLTFSSTIAHASDKAFIMKPGVAKSLDEFIAGLKKNPTPSDLPHFMEVPDGLIGKNFYVFGLASNKMIILGQDGSIYGSVDLGAKGLKEGKIVVEPNSNRINPCDPAVLGKVPGDQQMCWPPFGGPWHLRPSPK